MRCAQKSLVRTVVIEGVMVMTLLMMVMVEPASEQSSSGGTANVLAAIII